MINETNTKLSSIIAEAEEALGTMTPIPGNTRIGNSICSVGVLNSEENGKRLTFSKALSKKLGFEDKVSILPNIKTGELIVAKSIDSNKAYNGKLCGKEKKFCYNTAMVKMITAAFGLDFSKHTSKTFSTVKFVENGDIMVAFVTMVTPVVKQTQAVVEEVELPESEEDIEEFEFDEYEDDVEEVTED